MASKHLAVALGLTLTTAPAMAALPVPARDPVAPEGAATARYCLRMEPITGSRIESVRCETRDAWAQLEVDVDQEWAENGVRVIA